MKIAITGAAGLVGQNLVLLLRNRGNDDIVAIDKNTPNLAVLERLNPGVRTIRADLAEPGPWEDAFAGADAVVVLHTKITGKTHEPVERNNVTASERVFAALKRHAVPYVVHVSSSVVNF